ncbi:hypothetical protein FRACYDRAFT_249487 [Fragilariopsis cylindrus CCMP1102]|uniref:Uncharacterized protein n=1 Tax=Fragilariopsis cylindrus CCMP1102 TaxID=635003 RepID=A0A1E7ERT4_9STRA|nr:hypothetical protein FRACYDRAFT_249487 [Fragilariopsis cylindrus CCMP1102]|eukprot:OEU08595.1 hypothetical protein FRACYDRAFT_249487 [Fragilariopsis cylindrus CCMP1102]
MAQNAHVAKVFEMLMRPYQCRYNKAVLHHQYRPNNLKKLYGAQHYTSGYKVQLLLRALGRLGRCQGVLSHKKGHLGPKTGFPPLAPTSAWSCPQFAKFIFPLVYIIIPMFLLWDNSSF